MLHLNYRSSSLTHTPESFSKRIQNNMTTILLHGPLAREVRTFLFEDKLYTVMNPSVVESLPTITLAQPEMLLAPSLRRALLVTKCPELAYAPCNHHFTCNFLECLNCRVNNLPIVEDTQRTMKRWRLNPTTEAAWDSLEHTLFYIINILDNHTLDRREKIVGFNPFWPPPSDCGYHQAHNNERTARYAAHTSQTALIALSARCSMAMALTMGETPTNPPRWVQILLANKAPEDWVDQLRHSPISDFSRGVCTGIYIDPRPSVLPWLDHISCMVRSNVPVYIYWCDVQVGRLNIGQVEQILRQQTLLMPYKPDLQCIWTVPDDGPALVFQQPRGQPRTATHFCWSLLQKPPNWSPPTPQVTGESLPGNMGTSYRTSEDYPSYKARMRRHYTMHIIPYETAADRHARETRTQIANRFEKTNVSKVLLWTRTVEDDPCCNPGERDTWTIHVVARTRMATSWANYPDSQKDYDPFGDTWHICSALALGALLADDATWMEQHIPQDIIFSHNTSFRHSGSSMAYSSQALHHELAYMQMSMITTKDVIGKSFILANSDALGSEQMVNSTIAYIDGLKAQPQGIPPAHVWDLHPRSPHSLAHKPHPMMYIVRVELDKQNQYHNTYYHIRYKDDKTAWRIFLKDPITALELYWRTTCVNTAQAVNLLVLRRAAFQTFLPPTAGEAHTFCHEEAVPIYHITGVLSASWVDDVRVTEFQHYRVRLKKFLEGP
ncbi:hypothetical protein V8D89_012078 [Ganoderma adspersum]